MKKNNTKENVTFTLCTTYKEAIEKLLKLKGGWSHLSYEERMGKNMN